MNKKSNSIQTLADNFISNKCEKTFIELRKGLKPGLENFVSKYFSDRDLINEVVSQTFITIWEKLSQYNREYNFSTWTYAIAKNEALGILRIQKRNISHEKLTENQSKLLKIYSPEVSMDVECFGPSGETVVQFLYDKSLEEIKNLKEPYRTVMTQREIEKKQLQDIANNLGWNLNTVKTRLRKARNVVAVNLREKHPEVIDAYYEK